MRNIIILVVAFLVFHTTATARDYRLLSPNGQLEATITATDGQVYYSVVYRGDTLLRPSPLALNHTSGEIPLIVKRTATRSVDETIATPFTRQSTMRNHYNELLLRGSYGFAVVFRAYDEGIAYRFECSKPWGIGSEMVEYRFPQDWNATAPYVIHFDSTRADDSYQYSSSFENQYVTLPLSQLDTRRRCFLPLLVHGPNGTKMCISESGLLNYPGLYLRADGKGNLVGDHAPLPSRVEQGGHNNLQLLVKERANIIANIDRGESTPWRIMMVAPDAATLAGNNLGYLLAAPSRIDDISWIRPGKVAWDWWNYWNIGGVDFEAGINTNTYKHYIDFAAQYGVEYVILDEGWAVNGEADLFQVVPEIDLPLLARYAEEKGVGLILWAGYYAFERDMERVCQHYSSMGIKGFKIDFMDRDDQLAVDFHRRAAEMCAKYHLLVDYHGTYKPAGLNRTYPNVLNFEGVFGLEQMRWTPISYDQMRYDTELPFIRQLAGPMDYTPGAMLNGTKYTFFPSYCESMSQGTRCHQLALYIVFDGPLAMMCDSPTHYNSDPEYTRFLAAIPTVWDETRVLQGEVGEYVVMARRKGDTWYVGGITNWTARDVVVDLSPLAGSADAIELYTDGANAHRLGTDYKHTTQDVGTLTIHMAPGGGFVGKVESGKRKVLSEM